MGDTMHVVVGIMGNASSLLIYAAPIITFQRIIKKRSTEEYSCIPYIIALLNCFTYTWYGLPIVSRGWENFPVITINAIGILFEISFIFIYRWFVVPEQKKFVSLMVVPVIVLFTMTALVSSFVLHNHHHRKVFVGSIGIATTLCMYSSPLVAMKQVIKTKSVEFMPSHLSFFSFINSLLWMTYGLLGRDLFIAAPNIVGSPICLLQLVLYCIYRKSNKAPTEPNKKDLEKDGAFTTQLQEVNEKKLEN